MKGVKMKDKVISVCFSCDDGYVKHLSAVVASILFNANADEFIKIYVITDGFSKENKEKFECVFSLHKKSSVFYVKPNEELLKLCPSVDNAWFSIATYYRLFIPEIIPEDRVIYLDCDTIVRSSLFDLYSKDFGDNLLLGVKDISESGDKERLHLKKYLNAGVLLFNVSEMKKLNVVEKMFKFLSENRNIIKKHDQDILNCVFDGRTGYVEDVWNCQVRRKGASFFEKIENPRILHFISPKKPWTVWKPLSSTKWHREYFKYALMTEYKDLVYKYKRKSLLYFPLKLFYPSGWVKDVLNFIISFKNSKDKKYRIITLLGIKFRIKKC